MKPDVDQAGQSLADCAAPYAATPARCVEAISPALYRTIVQDRALAAASRTARAAVWPDVVRRVERYCPQAAWMRFRDAFLAVPRERFVLPEDIGRAAEDTPLPLDPTNLATVSAPHAYFLTYGLLNLDRGDLLVELGTGTGYGAALAEVIVSAAGGEPHGAHGSERPPVDQGRGHVWSIEIDRALHEHARHALLGHAERISLFWGDAHGLASEAIGHATAAAGNTSRVKVAVTFALKSSVDWLVSLLPEGAALVCPVVVREDAEAGQEGQELMRFLRKHGALDHSRHGVVRYVGDRREAKQG